jgi:hypothetical protein
MEPNPSRTSRLVPPGGTAFRELIHAIAQALTLPNDIVSQSESVYLRLSRDRARVVLFGLRRFLADREISDSAIVGIANDIKYQAGVLEDGDASPADPMRAFVESIIAALAAKAAEPAPSDRVVAACRRAMAGANIEDADIAAAVALLTGDDQGAEAET